MKFRSSIEEMKNQIVRRLHRGDRRIRLNNKITCDNPNSQTILHILLTVILQIYKNSKIPIEVASATWTFQPEVKYLLLIAKQIYKTKTTINQQAQLVFRAPQVIIAMQAVQISQRKVAY